MLRSWVAALSAGILGLGLWAAAAPARAQEAIPGPTPNLYQPVPGAHVQLDRFFYYPYYYFPHNYWPSQSPKWPEPTGAPHCGYPAYMAYPPFLEQPGWRYEMWTPQRYYRGFHFWLDQL